MGKLSPLDGIGPKDIGLQKLFDRATDGAVREVILATNFTAEGEATAHVIGEALRLRGLQVTRLARGVPAGSELEYVDLGTIAHAWWTGATLHGLDAGAGREHRHSLRRIPLSRVPRRRRKWLPYVKTRSGCSRCREPVVWIRLSQQENDRRGRSCPIPAESIDDRLPRQRRCSPRAWPCPGSGPSRELTKAGLPLRLPANPLFIPCR
jgi:hypothetical protein